jgi:hypothetical protein
MVKAELDKYRDVIESRSMRNYMRAHTQYEIAEKGRDVRER